MIKSNLTSLCLFRQTKFGCGILSLLKNFVLDELECLAIKLVDTRA